MCMKVDLSGEEKEKCSHFFPCKPVDNTSRLISSPFPCLPSGGSADVQKNDHKTRKTRGKRRQMGKCGGREQEKKRKR